MSVDPIIALKHADDQQFSNIQLKLHVIPLFRLSEQITPCGRSSSGWLADNSFLVLPVSITDGKSPHNCQSSLSLSSSADRNHYGPWVDFPKTPTFRSLKTFSKLGHPISLRLRVLASSKRSLSFGTGQRVVHAVSHSIYCGCALELHLSIELGNQVVNRLWKLNGKDAQNNAMISKYYVCFNSEKTAKTALNFGTFWWGFIALIISPSSLLICRPWTIVPGDTWHTLLWAQSFRLFFNLLTN